MTTKPCARCGQPIPWVTSGGRRVKPSEYARRTHCGKRCAGLAGPPPPRHVGGGRSYPRPNSVRERFVQLLAAYRGLPLTADDVADELGVTRRTVQDVAGKLIREGRITRTTAEDKRTALYRAVAMEAAA